MHLQRDQHHHCHQDGEEGAPSDALARGAVRSTLVEVVTGGRGAGASTAGGAAAARRATVTTVATGHTARAAISTRNAVASGSSRAAGGGGGLGAGARPGARAGVGALGTEIHVQAGGAQGAKDGGVAGDLNIAFHGVAGGVNVGVLGVAGLLGVLGRVVALDVDLADGGVVVAGVLDVLAVPVNLTASPVNGTLGVAGLTSGPQGHLQAGGGLGVLVAVGSLVPGVGLLQGALDVAVDDPLGLVGLPVNLVGVPVGVGVTVVDGGIGAVVPCRARLVLYSQVDYSRRPHTVQDTLPVVVGLHVSKIGADPLVVDLILDIGQQDESSHHTLATAALNLARNLAVPDIVVVGKESTHTLLGHGHDQIAIFVLGEATVGPVGLGGVAEVLGVQNGVIIVIPSVGLILANGHRGAGVDRIRRERVASTQTVGARTTFSIL